MGVALERTYHSISDPDQEIPSDQRVKGYKYGKTLVPFSKVDESVLKYEANSCMKVIGFTSAKNVPSKPSIYVSISISRSISISISISIFISTSIYLFSLLPFE